jgi:hypothetical protein
MSQDKMSDEQVEKLSKNLEIFGFGRLFAATWTRSATEMQEIPTVEKLLKTIKKEKEDAKEDKHTILTGLERFLTVATDSKEDTRDAIKHACKILKDLQQDVDKSKPTRPGSSLG